MGWQRFRDFEQAREALWIEPGDPRLIARIRSLWEFSSRLLGGRSAPRGLRRFRSIEEANEDRERWIAERARALRAARRAP
jgi:hypothetical protein